MKRLILASNNKKKLVELRAILADTGIEVISQRDAGCDFEVDENSDTFAGNAYLKAAAVTEATGEAAVSDDSGLCVDALGGEPGVLSARYTGNHEDTDEDRNAYLLRKMENVELRTARFVSSICCTLPNGDVIRAEGTCEGEILDAPRGAFGFGYDPLFLVSGTGKSMAELTPEEKNKISHRAVALEKFKEELRKYNAAHQ